VVVVACKGAPVADAPVALPGARAAVVTPKERVMLLLDMSSSMRAGLDDDAQTRFEGAKASVVTLIREHATTPIGLVLFGKDARMVSPATMDHEAELTAVEAATLGKTINPNGTSLGRAIAAADAALGDDHSPARVVIFTDAHSGRADGASDDDAIGAARIAASHGRRITIVQVSTREVVSVEDGVDLFGKPRFDKVKLAVDRELMDALAAATGGRVLVKPSAADLRRVVE
jgi:Ca-activated chloride channel family protein